MKNLKTWTFTFMVLIGSSAEAAYPQNYRITCSVVAASDDGKTVYHRNFELNPNFAVNPRQDCNLIAHWLDAATKLPNIYVTLNSGDAYGEVIYVRETRVHAAQPRRTAVSVSPAFPRTK